MVVLMVVVAIVGLGLTATALCCSNTQPTRSLAVAARSAPAAAHADSLTSSQFVNHMVNISKTNVFTVI